VARENVEVVRRPLALKPRSRRRLEERLALRFPRVLALVGRAVWRLPLRSQLRQAVIRRALVSAWEALNRRDLEVTFLLYHPDVEAIFAPQLATVGFDAVYHGREARVEVQKQVIAEWGQFQFESEDLIELGRAGLLTLMRFRATGPRSGVPVETEYAAIFKTFDGQVTHEQVFLDHAEALRAAGLQD
jgi:ketosteroid isomerase-like protein